jgi:hypothetical protein
MTGKELIDKLTPYQNTELEFIHYETDNTVEIWVNEGLTYIATVECIY